MLSVLLGSFICHWAQGWLLIQSCWEPGTLPICCPLHDRQKEWLNKHGCPVLLGAILQNRKPAGSLVPTSIQLVKALLTGCELFAMSGDSLPQKHFTMCPSMAVPFTETMAWAALSWEENLKRKTAAENEQQYRCRSPSPATCLHWHLEAKCRNRPSHYLMKE